MTEPSAFRPASDRRHPPHPSSLRATGDTEFVVARAVLCTTEARGRGHHARESNCVIGCCGCHPVAQRVASRLQIDSQTATTARRGNRHVHPASGDAPIVKPPAGRRRRSHAIVICSARHTLSPYRRRSASFRCSVDCSPNPSSGRGRHRARHARGAGEPIPPPRRPAGAVDENTVLFKFSSNDACPPCSWCSLLPCEPTWSAKIPQKTREAPYPPRRPKRRTVRS